MSKDNSYLDGDKFAEEHNSVLRSFDFASNYQGRFDLPQRSIKEVESENRQLREQVDGLRSQLRVSTDHNVLLVKQNDVLRKTLILALQGLQTLKGMITPK